jgi:hypothetical protein
MAHALTFFHLTHTTTIVGFKVGGLVSVLAENFVRSFVRKNLFCFLGLFVLVVLVLVVERGIFNMVQSVLFLVVVVVLPYQYRAGTRKK